MSRPKWQHYCKACIYLGEYKGSDLYFCPQGGLPTVLARYGNDGPDYTSGLGLEHLDPAIAEAKRLAEECGLLTLDRQE